MRKEIKERFAEASRLINLGRLEAAREALYKLSLEDPKSAALFAVLGYACWETGLLDEAVAAFRSAVNLKPTLELVSLGLFHCLWRQGKRVQALEEAERFMTLSESAEYEEIVRAINEKE